MRQLLQRPTVAAAASRDARHFRETDVMSRLVAGLILLSSIVSVSLATAQTAPPDCNPYILTCHFVGGPSTGPSNPYDPTLPHGPYTGSGPYGVPAATLAAATQVWAIDGEVYIDPVAGANRFGWLVLENLSSDPQQAIIEYMSEAWAMPAYRIQQLLPKGRLSVGLHDDGALAGAYVGVRVYFEKPGTTHATFRPHATDTIGQHDVPGVLVPRDPAGTH